MVERALLGNTVDPADAEGALEPDEGSAGRIWL
jgi:hypothetical protein